MDNIINDGTYSRTRITTKTGDYQDPSMRRTFVPSWKSVLAGILLSLATFIGLAGLGLAMGGIGLYDGARLENASTFSGIWIILSALIAIFAGSFFAGRMLSSPTDSPLHSRSGMGQGLMIGAIFAIFLVWQAINTVGLAGRVLGNVVGGATVAAGAGATSISESPAVRQVVEDSMGDLNLKSDINTVATGVLSRVVNGNNEGAKNYLANQAGITPAEADQRIATLQAKANEAIVSARKISAEAMQVAGWSLFALMFLSLVVGAFGGTLGARYIFSESRQTA